MTKIFCDRCGEEIILHDYLNAVQFFSIPNPVVTVELPARNQKTQGILCDLCSTEVRQFVLEKPKQ